MSALANAKTLLFTIGPIFLPKAISYFRSTRTKVTTTTVPVRPVPKGTRRALNILFISAVLALISTLPVFGPEDIFTTTDSRIQIPNDVLFNRLSTIRPLTDADRVLQSKLVSFDARLFYFQYGPSVLINCPFCNSDLDMSYLYYAFPSIMAPHLLHIFVLGLVTSAMFCGPESAAWRISSTIVGASLALYEVSSTQHYNRKLNTSAMRLSEIDFFHWRSRVYRGIAIATVDILLAGLIYLSSTNRAFVKPVTPAQRIEQSTQIMDLANKKLHALGVTRNVVLREENLRKKAESYWKIEGKIMGEVYEDREVVEGVHGALTRMNIKDIEADAEKYADGVMSGIQTVAATGVVQDAQT